MSELPKQKTLLFSISAGDCFKNFAAFEGSLFDLLGASLDRKELRLVFLAPSEKAVLRERLEKYRDAHTGQVVVEYVALPQRTRVQKIFTFFYSYLLYTGTTRTLATMGMRLSDAPGGGKTYLAPIKWLLSRTLGKIRFVRETLVPYLYERLFPQHPFADVFDRYKPDLVFTPNFFDRFDYELSREAKHRGVQRLGMVLNWDHYDKYFLPFLPDDLLAQAEQMKDFAVRFQGKDRANIRIVGYPFLDFLKNPHSIVSRGDVLKELGFPPNAKYILYVAGSMYCPDEPDIIEEILRWADSGEIGKNVYLVIRPYPRSGARGKDIDFDEKKFEGFAQHPRVSTQVKEFFNGMENDATFVNIMRHADAVLAIYSTAVLPAAALDRPLITTAFDGHKVRPFNRSVLRFELREHFKDILQTGGQARTVSFDDLKQKLTTYLEHPETDAEKRAALRTRVVDPLDGKASERVYNALMSGLS